MTLTGTASLLHNNLACSSTGWLATVHNSINAGGGKLLLSKLGGDAKEGPEISQAMSIRYLESLHGPVLSVSSTNGTQIYNEDATALLFFAPINDSAVDSATLKHHQGACIVPAVQHIVIGTSKGSLMIVHVAAADQFMALPESAPCSPATAIADLCFAAMTSSVVSAHTSGELRVWTVNPTGPYSNPTVLPAISQAPVRILSLGARLLVAYGPGIVCLFDAVTYDLQVEVTAHARWLTACDVREEEDTGCVATVGEDTVLNVWQVNAATGRIALQHTSVVTDKLLTGVALHGSGFVVTAYDCSEVFHIAHP